MSSSANPLLLLGLIQDLQKQAADLGLSRTAAALEVTGHVATEELSDVSPPVLRGQPPATPAEEETAD